MVRIFRPLYKFCPFLLWQSIQAQLLPISTYITNDVPQVVELSNPDVVDLLRKKTVEVDGALGTASGQLVYRVSQSRSGCFPLKDTAATREYFSSAELSTLRMVGLWVSTDASSDDRFSMYTELISDYIKIGGSYFRISFGGAVVGGDSENSEALARFMQTGGNAVLQFATPVWYTRGTSNWGFDVVLSPRFSADIPAVSSQLQTSAGNMDLGMELLGFVPSVNNTFSLFVNGRVGWVWGTYEFSRLLSANRSFLFGRLLFGIDIDNKFRINAIGPAFGPSAIIDNSPWQVGVILLQ